MGWNLIGMLDHQGGIGNAARSNVQAMKHLTARHRSISFPSPRHQKPEDVPAIHGRNYLHFNPSGISIAGLTEQTWFRRGTNVGFWAWETTEPPAHWKSFDPYMAQIWVPSEFVRQALLSNGFTTPVHVIAHAVDEKPQHVFNDGGPVTFLVQFDGHSRFQRKRPDWSLQAIVSACLKSGTPARIILKCHHDSGAGIVIPEYDGIEILKLDRWLEPAQMEDVWREVDILVSLNRGEGFGLPMVEAMARGSAVVATNWSASLEYLTEYNSFPVEVEKLENVTDSSDAFFKTGQWAKPKMTHAVDQILRCIADIASGRIYQTAKNARTTAATFSFENLMLAMKDAITKL